MIRPILAMALALAGCAPTLMPGVYSGTLTTTIALDSSDHPTTTSEPATLELSQNLDMSFFAQLGECEFTVSQSGRIASGNTCIQGTITLFPNGGMAEPTPTGIQLQLTWRIIAVVNGVTYNGSATTTFVSPS